MNTDQDDIIGTGWAHPATITRDGRIATADGITDIEQSITLILSTVPGERPMRPEFGCAIHGLVFDPHDAATAAQAETHVRTALERFEPRVDVDDVLVSVDPDRPDVLYLDIRYRPRATNQPRNLVYPFYTAPSAPAPNPGR
ncbi:GPW/gp25 family protein [Embleya hyalina]|uniref:IraD/Gp25-like domain-containing protein n=1 Tax=Embleya hyalina TaxID=516124 RepID=A0A401Z4K8_9ACTN|nr:GPW/gp25 family protein [Embleya hyalina]GCE01789.1 hypothetical protein EHYA_09563 [Embleya hyalina]